MIICIQGDKSVPRHHESIHDYDPTPTELRLLYGSIDRAQRMMDEPRTADERIAEIILLMDIRCDWAMVEHYLGQITNDVYRLMVIETISSVTPYKV